MRKKKKRQGRGPSHVHLNVSRLGREKGMSPHRMREAHAKKKEIGKRKGGRRPGC